MGGENSILSLRKIQELSTISVLKKMCSSNVQQIYRGSHVMSKYDFNKVTSAWVFSIKFTAYFRTTFSKNTSGGVFLKTPNFHLI